MINVADARRHVLQFLSHRADCQAHNIEEAVAAAADLQRLDVRGVVHEVIRDLVVERVLTIKSDDGYNWAFLRLTDFGQEVVKEQRWSPYDPDGYLKELANVAPRLAGLCEMYIAEAPSCFRVGSYLATAVMLGAASEGNVLDLFGRYHGAMAKGGCTNTWLSREAAEGSFLLRQVQGVSTVL